MKDTNILIKNIAFDIISITTVWGLLNNQYATFNVRFNNKVYNISSIMPLIGFSFSTYLLIKYI